MRSAVVCHASNPDELAVCDALEAIGTPRPTGIRQEEAAEGTRRSSPVIFDGRLFTMRDIGFLSAQFA